MTGVESVPFVVGQWVRGTRFYGRAAQIAEILDGPRNWIWLVGTRRLGKTSLLKQLEHLATTEPERGYVPIFWDLQGAENAGELQQALGEALYDAEEQFDEIGIDLSDILTDHAITTLSQTRRKLRAAGRRLLLLCDEAEELITIHRKDPPLLRRLRRTLQAHDEVRVVLTSTIRLGELADERGDTSPFLHGFAPPLYLSTLSKDDARALIRQTNLAPATRPALTDEQVEAIRAQCDNHPYLLQLVSKRFLERGDLEAVFRQVTTDRMVSYFFSIDFEMLSPVEQSILRIVAQQSAATSDTIRGTLRFEDRAVGAGLDRLAELAFIRRGPDRSFLLCNSFFRTWLEDWVREHDVDAVVTQVGDLPAPSSSGVSDVLDTIDGRYELLAREGEGATGIVYRARDTLLHTEIAIKMLRPEYCANEGALERFRREIVLSRDISHPNVLRTYHLGEDTHCTYLTMQWVDGQTLAQLIVDEAPLDEGAAVKIVAKLTGRARSGARAQGAAPRHQAAEHHGQPAARALSDGFRGCPGAGRAWRDLEWCLPRHPQLRLAGAGRTPAARRAVRPVCIGGRAVRAGGRSAPVPGQHESGRADAAQEDGPARPAGSAARSLGGPRRRHSPVSGQGPSPTLPECHRATAGASAPRLEHSRRLLRYDADQCPKRGAWLARPGRAHARPADAAWGDGAPRAAAWGSGRSPV